jgi:ABC-type nitrate/sulfonate/bicarbonate transport system permease component
VTVPLLVPGYSRRFARQLGDWVPAAVVLVGVLGIWEGSIYAFHVQQFLLPKPTDIAKALWNEGGTL